MSGKTAYDVNNLPVYQPQRCTAKIVSGPRKGQPCQSWAIQGGTVCNRHGGQLPPVKKSAARKMAALRADHFLAKNGQDIQPLEDPVDELLKLAAEAKAAKDFFAGKIEELRYSARTGEQLRAEVALWERSMERCVKILTDITKLGIAERRTRIAEAQAVMLLGVVDEILDQLNLTPEQQSARAEIVSSSFERMAESQS